MTKVCQEAFIRKEPCINGKRNVKITNYVRENGKCRPFRSKTNLYCDSEKKQFCKCNVVDNIHYRTYDGQSIHFSGGCRYTLTRYNGTSDSCSFNIEIQNEHGYGNKHLAHTKSVIIHMFGEKFELGQHKTLKIGNYQRLIPYEQGEDVRIFYSNNVVQFVAPKCSVHVAFDQQSNAFIEVSKIYSKRMNGICGSCNEIQDDLKTKSGKDVSKKKDKYSRIANSYKVTVPGKYCKTAEHISYKNLCRKNFIKKANARNLCKAIISRDSPFRKCGQQAHVDLKNFYEDCLIDLCTNKNRRQHPQRVQCKILGILSEVCAESGIPGIKWRTHFNCPKKCGKNEHFTHKASPCPRTCENHFFGTRSPCYDLPEREGCECNKGYIRDGALCVKPMHCNCINLCVDRKGSENCRKWKARGDCEKFQEPMNIMCRKTCNFCKQRAQSCENEISTKQCLLFRRQGLCFNEFYRSICGLTCNYDKCKCEDDKSIVEKCNANNIKTTTHYSFARNSNGRCVKIVKQTHQICDVPPDWTVYGICNFCTGKRNITRYGYDVVKMKLVPRSQTRYENCQKCEKNIREQRHCISDKYLQTTVYFNRLNGCFQCVPDCNISTPEIICKTTQVVKMIDDTTQLITIHKRTLLNCQCRLDIITKTCKIGCKGMKITKMCQNGKFLYQKVSYKLFHCNCIRKYSYRIDIPKCQPKSPKFGPCITKNNGAFYSVTQYTAHVNAHCKCVRKTVKQEKPCDCKKPHEYTTCEKNTGMLTTVYLSYQPVLRGEDFYCVKKTFVNSVLINFPTQFLKRRGVCKSNNKRTNKIYRKFRDGCVIRTLFYKYEEEICDCGKILPKKTSCESDHQVVREFKLEFQDVVKPYCLEKLISEQKFPIICPNKQINETNCFNERKTVTTISYSNQNCKCVKKIDTVIEKCNCTRRVISEKILKCDKRNKQIYITVYINEECDYETLVCRYACCKQSVIETRHCSSSTGLITTTIERFYDIKKQFKCFSNIVSTIIKPNCNNVKVIKQKCGQERNNYKKITTISQILLRETCSCKTITTSIWKCCKLPNPIITKSCRGNYLLIKVVNYKFDNNKINCIPQISYRIERIQCPSIKDTFQIKKLPNCKYKQTRFYYEIENCKCKLRENSEIYYYSCCKQKPPTVNCVNNTKLVTTSTTFQLSNDRKQCRKYVRKTTQNIICPKSKESWKGKISDCLYPIITQYYQVKKCKCEMYNRTIEKRQFCCKKPVITLSCWKDKIWRETTTKYTIDNDGKCIQQISFRDIVQKCSTPYSTVCPCPGNPRLKSIIRHFSVTVNCKCVDTQILIPCPCHKIPNKIEIGLCSTKFTRTVKVFKSVNVKKGCKWELLKSYQDVCKCEDDSVNKTCLKHSIHRTTTIKYNLVKIPDQFPKHTCVESKLVSDKIIECNKNYIYYGNCINHRQSVIECVYRSVNCKCEMSCHISRYRCCEFQKLDYCKTTCIRNVKYTICYKHKSGPSRCILDFTSKIPIVEKCPSKTNIQCRESNYPINNCYYKSCDKTFYVYRNCRCVTDTQTKNTIIRARKPTRQIRCIHNRKVVKITNFIVKQNRCQPLYHEEFINIECPRWKVIKTKKHGYTHYKITYYKVENCECIPKICQGLNFRKRCPFSKLETECSRNNQLVYTQINREIHSTNRRLCPESGSPIREQICIENRKTRIEPIKCPNSYEIITCIVSRDITRIKKYFYKVVNCKCVEAVIIVQTSPCKPCNESIINESSCRSLNADGIGYVQITTKYWRITKNICKPYIKKSKRICCPRRIRRTSECVNGRNVFKTVIIEEMYECKPRISIISDTIPCYNNGKPNKWIIERIHTCSRPCEFTIKYLVRMQFNPKTCGCRRVRRSVKIDMCLRPCRYRTVCRHNNKIVTISDCQRSEKWKCINYKRETSVDLICPKNLKRVIGDCKGRVIRYRIISYKSVKCQCVKVVKEYIQNKISDVTKCISEMWRTKHIDYELYGHRCVPKRPQITFKPVYCSKFETFEDKRINECKFSRSYFRKFVSNCRCVDRLVRNETLHYKCCQKPRISKHCVNHNTRVVVTTYFKLLNFKCYPVTRESRSTVDCSHFKFQKSTNTSLCTYKTVHYYGAAQNCACYKIPKFTIFDLKSCCFPIPPPVTSCDNKRGVLITVIRNDTLVKHKCIPRISTIEKPINCDGRICETRYGKCIRNTQTVEMFCLKREGCQCVKQIFTRRNVCCGPNKDSTWTKTGECGKRLRYYKLITTFALKLDYRTKQCRPVVIKQQYKVCGYRNPIVEISCFNNIYIKTRRVSYSINFLKNIHDEIIDESVSLISGCHKTLNFTLDERETTPDGWCIRTSKITTPVNCKCIERIEKTRFKCPCYKSVDVLRRRYCENNDIIVDETLIPKCRLNNIYWTIIRTFTRIVNCLKKEILYSPTFYCSSSKNNCKLKFCIKASYETRLQWNVDKCVCRDKEIEKRLVCVECFPPHQNEACIRSEKFELSYSYLLVNGICNRNFTRKLVHVPCPTQPEIHQSKCINNKYTITTTHYYYDNCQCKPRVEEKTCHCKCGKDSKEIKCSRNYFFNEITTKYYKRDCKCFKTENIIQIEPSCPLFINQSLGQCEIRKHHSIYRNITRRQIEKNTRNCTCEVVEKPENVVCDCDKEITKHNVCINNNNFVIQKWGWKINVNKNRCEKVILNIDSKLISCPPMRIDQVCNYTIGTGEETTTKYNLVNCKCIESKFVRPINCTCIPKQPVLKHRGDCNRITRMRIDVYEEARGNSCVPVIVNKPVICKCNDTTYSTFCVNNRFVHVTTSFKLVNDYCRETKYEKDRYINCSTNIERKESQCYDNGYKIIEFYKFAVYKCKCMRTRIELQNCRCKCPPKKLVTECDKSGKVLIDIHYNYELINCDCKENKIMKIKPISCPQSSKRVSGCNELLYNVFWFNTTTIIDYDIRHCKCIPTNRTFKSICKNNDFLIINIVCNKEIQTEIRKVLRVKFENGRFVNTTTTEKIPITCNDKWVIENQPICRPDGLYGTEVRIYQRLIFKNCGCQLEKKIKRCDCICTGPSKSKKCDGNINRIYHYEYKLVRCKCKQLIIKEESEQIYCNSLILQTGPCYRKDNYCVRDVEHQDSVLINCQCIGKRRTSQKICHSCCGGPSTEKYCNEKLNKFITKVSTCNVAFSGLIQNSWEIKEQDIPCKVESKCVSIDGCNIITNTEKLECTTTYLENCVCVSKTKIENQLCVCGPTKLQYGNCNMKTGTQEVYQIESKLVVLINGKKNCKDQKKKLKDELCDCVRKNSYSEKCLNNRLIQKIEKYTFNSEMKTCDSKISQNDITESCRPAVEKFRETCNSITNQIQIKTITRQLVNCKCITTTTNIETELCRCPEDRTETECIGNKFETIKFIKYTMDKERKNCIPTVNQKSEEIKCPLLDTVPDVDIMNADKCIKIVNKVKNCTCVRVTTPHSCRCTLSCPADEYINTCENGVSKIVETKYNLDDKLCKCIKNIAIKNKLIECKSTPKIKYANNEVLGNGIYNVETTYSEKKIECHCKEQTSTRYFLIKCLDNYEPIPSLDRYDKKCKIPEPNITCPENSTNSLVNGKNEVTYYVIQNGKCVKNTTVTKCDECTIYYCAERSNTCDSSECSQEAVKATCPITCGICEPCPGNGTKCETNPFDGKQYSKKEQ